MELPVSLQLRELELALALGAALGLVYDLLRPLRRGSFFTVLCDGLWCLLSLASLLLFTLYAGRGQLRLFALAGMALSGGLWLGLISPLIRRLQSALAEQLRALVKKEKKAENICEKK